MGYTRRSDYIEGLAWFAAGPALMWFWEKRSPSYVGKGGFAPMMRLTMVCSATAAFLRVYQNSICTGIPYTFGERCLQAFPHVVRFYGFTENKREVDMDMREMVGKIKKSEPLYGTSELTPYMQGVAARNSRYSALMIHVIPWFNFVNHPQVRPNVLPFLILLILTLPSTGSIQPNIIARLRRSLLKRLKNPPKYD